MSLAVYRICWSHGESMRSDARSAIFSLFLRPLPWVLHGLVVAAMSSLSWDEIPHLRLMAMSLIGLLALGAIGRLGAAERGRFFIADRLVIAAMAASVWFTPVMIYPCLIVCCALQYSVASWRLGPGYSNLLGYEFVRASLCVMVMGMAIMGMGLWCDWQVFESSGLVLGALFLYQASTYVNHALAKCALGPRWHSWIMENRIECLFANAWLRGWTAGISRQTMQSLVRWLGKHRRVICASAWLLEMSWLLAIADIHLASVVLSATIIFHLVVFAFTGLVSYAYVANHLCWLYILSRDETAIDMGTEMFWAAMVVFPLTACWIAWLHRRLFDAYRTQGKTSSLSCYADAADHLMAWWDTPLMRMFSYTIETASGRRCYLPVPKFSPHDTAMTDIHTAIMILGLHQDFDPAARKDRTNFSTGVWGLTVDHEVRNRLYQMMDAEPNADDAEWENSLDLAPWKIDDRSHHAATPLVLFFQGINHMHTKWWFRSVLRWPHFPGEDLAPDWCPIGHQDIPRFAFDESIASVTIWRVKTFAHPSAFRVVEEELVGTISLNPSESHSRV